MADKYVLSHTGEQVDTLLTKINDLQEMRSFIINVETSKWVPSTKYAGYTYVATLAVPGVTKTNNIVVTLASTATIEQESDAAAAAMRCKEQGIDVVMLYARTKPTKTLPIMITILD
jgi:hypothetical protein